MIKYLAFFSLLLVFGCQSLKVSPEKATLINVQTKEDHQIADMIEPYKDSMSAFMNEVIGEFGVDMKRIKHEPETVLGNFVADLTYDLVMEAHDMEMIDFMPDMCLLNFGGLRTSIAKGPVTRSKVFELMPFENNIVAVKMEKKDMEELFNYLAKVGGQPISHAKLLIKNGEAKEYTVRKKPLTDRSYWVVTSDYLANGGDKMNFFVGKERLSFIKLREAILGTIEQSKEVIVSRIEGRIVKEDGN